MEIKINRNIIWAKVFVEQLVRLGVKEACVSPGSRSTPLTYAIAANKNIKSTVNVDERSSAFFALGLAKQTSAPVLVVTTSGTAAAELYPAIIEAYQSRVPLIICTADRPSYLRNRGANQTINQDNIYKNHIRYYAGLTLPEVTVKDFASLKRETAKAFRKCSIENRGPVHINMPFEKPFEPDSYTDILSARLMDKIWSFRSIDTAEAKKDIKIEREIKALAARAGKIEKGLILCGPGTYSEAERKQISLLSKKTGYPVAADGASGLRAGAFTVENLIPNFTSLCKSKQFTSLHAPEMIIQFGSAPTSASVLDFYRNSKAVKYLVNGYGDWTDPSLTSNKLIKCNIEYFCRAFIKSKASRSAKRKWLNKIKSFDSSIGKLKDNYINNQPFPFEGRIVNEIISSLPAKCNLVISNSLPVRDFDSFAGVTGKQINLFTNRGASGIDGIISTALGIAASSKDATYLVIGDLAFYYDLNALSAGVKNSISLKIIVVNNNGGGIFEHLPIASYPNVFTEYFKTPLNVDFERLSEAHGCSYSLIEQWTSFRKEIKDFRMRGLIEVTEIKTDSTESLGLRRNFWNSIDSVID